MLSLRLKMLIFSIKSYTSLLKDMLETKVEGKVCKRNMPLQVGRQQEEMDWKSVWVTMMI